MFIVIDLNKPVTLSIELRPTLFVLQIKMIPQIACLVDDMCAVTILSDEIYNLGQLVGEKVNEIPKQYLET